MNVYQTRDNSIYHAATAFVDVHKHISGQYTNRNEMEEYDPHPNCCYLSHAII